MIFGIATFEIVAFGIATGTCSVLVHGNKDGLGHKVLLSVDDGFGFR